MSQRDTAPSFLYEPQVLYLYQLLDELHRGLLRIPKFQRPFRWTLEERLALLDSVREGLPIGGLLVWRTSKTVVTQSEVAEKVVGGEAGVVHQYVLDGLQRLTTFYGALYSDGPYAAFYDLATDEFVEREEEGEPLLPMNAVLDSVKLLAFQRQLLRGRPDAEDLVRKAEAVARSFREYKLTVIAVVTDDLAVATKTFQRINRRGQILGETDMVHALTWTEAFSLNELLDDLLERQLAPLGWAPDSLRDGVVFRAIKVALGLDAYENDGDVIAGRLKNRPDTPAEVVAALRRAILFLRDSIGVLEPELLPSRSQLLCLAEAFRSCPEPASKGLRLMEAWFWVTAIGGTFTRPGGALIARMIGYVRELARGVTGEWPARRLPRREPLPSRFDLRDGRARALTILLAEAKANAEQSGRDRNSYLEHGRMQPAFDRSQVGHELVACAGNYLLVDQAEAGRERDAEWLSLQGFEAPAGEAIRAGDLRSAVLHREALLNRLDQREFSYGMWRLDLDGGPLGGLLAPRGDATHPGGTLRVRGLLGGIPQDRHAWLVYRRWSASSPTQQGCWPLVEVLGEFEEFEVDVELDTAPGLVALELIVVDRDWHEALSRLAPPRSAAEIPIPDAVPTLDQVFIDIAPTEAPNSQ